MANQYGPYGSPNLPIAPPFYPDLDAVAPSTFHTDSLRNSTVVIRVAPSGRVELFQSLPYDTSVDAATAAVNGELRLRTDAQSGLNEKLDAAEADATGLRERLAHQADYASRLYGLLDDAKQLLDLRKRGVKDLVAAIDQALDAA